MRPKLELVSHPLCPYVQRAAIALAEKGVPFTRTSVDLAARPDWFTRLSPLGKVPLLIVDDEVLFESAVICDYLDETIAPRLHPEDPLARARHRAWIEYGSAILNAIGNFYNAAERAPARLALREKFARLEPELGEGPWFAGASFCMVDAAFGPIFRYFDVFDQIADFGILTGLPRLQAWRAALATRPSVRAAVGPDYRRDLHAFLRDRGFQ
ncbi:glutathione S-transferase family protein [Oxalobacteraceae bacterium]|nr:glutathione S-transferase family protein [Oxalobacteraceae bacterium]